MFPRRGVYRQDSLGLQTGFPFGFLEKTRRVDSPLQVLVYPSVDPAEDFHEVLPRMTGELESFLRGRGNDLYSIRDYQTTDTARHVDWKASAKAGVLQVREFAREDERQVLLVFDPVFSQAWPEAISSGAGAQPAANAAEAAAALASGFRSRRRPLRQPGLAFLRARLRADVSYRGTRDAHGSRRRKYL